MGEAVKKENAEPTIKKTFKTPYDNTPTLDYIWNDTVPWGKKSIKDRESAR
jgi:hypothetical protein